MPDKQIQKVELATFISTEDRKSGSSRGRFPIYQRNRSPSARVRRGRKEERGPFDANSMLIKLGVCAVACALVLLLKWIDTPLTNAAIDAVKDATGEQSDFDEMLGKLRFVELPGILSVFSPTDKLTLPIDYSGASLERDDTLLVLDSNTEQAVAACANGIVKSIGMDDSLGRYISFIVKEDIEIIYYGFTSVNVEEGQILKLMDHLGGIPASGALYIAVRSSGQPVNPLDYFNIAIDEGV